MEKAIIEKIDPSSVPEARIANLFKLFNKMGIGHTTYEHPPIFTMEEGLVLNLPAHIPGQHGKSLFLRAEADKSFWLVVACETTRADLKKLAKELEAKRFSFAKPEEMVEILGVAPGSATPFALMNDANRQVRVVIDKTFLEAKECVFHPLDNRYSTVIAVADMIGFIEKLGFQPIITALT